MSSSHVKPLDLVERQAARTVADLDLHSYYQLLEIEQGSSTQVVLDAHALLSREYGQVASHPACSTALREDLALIRARLDEAAQVLRDWRLRQIYDEQLELGKTRMLLAAPQSSKFSLEDFDPPAPSPRRRLMTPAPKPLLPEPALLTPTKELTFRPCAPERGVAAEIILTSEEVFDEEADTFEESTTEIMRRFIQAIEVMGQEAEGGDLTDQPPDDDEAGH